MFVFFSLAVLTETHLFVIGIGAQKVHHGNVGKATKAEVIGDIVQVS